MNGREFKEQHQKELDDKFIVKYPHGRFTLQHCPEYNSFGMYRAKKRNTSWISHFDLGVTYGTGTYDKIIKCRIVGYQNNSKGNCYHFNSFEKMIDVAKKKNFPKNLIDTFTDLYMQDLVIK